ncbi:DNA mismatch repair protein MutS [Thermotoga petrophila RKU-1]|uniref:DNA mismatch repair protein MutS n=1 Tax=Thermotoga petrophila (strain ATCC BAA-488 / DSM 13995 / JCM 10881 / RKU-1) TaxID=390874 RepID=MUTS_THEP1|nr:DNA mismatch repair protein MutS [Thermotoga petrophila]A5ILG0.1 RecName: Full=DNA mismatch repair protein MutS [Thermotoga petrophila RKU-1]ABQ47033.1 DNA mismatch repair protein MutS [Thermotoga petrophila RKU-1]
MKVTPLMEQYLRIKEQYKDSILLFRLGDFYEAFFEDAKIVSKVLNIVLTRRQDAPMAGIPYHALNSYLKKLVEAGYKVAICDQMEEPSKSKKLIRREVTRVVTPGSILEDEFLSETNNYMAVVSEEKGQYCTIFCDVSTGEVLVHESSDEQETMDLLKNYSISQIVCPDHLKPSLKERFPGVYTESISEWYFSDLEEVEKAYNLKDIHHFELSSLALKTLAALIKYVKYTMITEELNLKPPLLISQRDYMILDSATVENLSLIPGDRGKNLFDVLNNTETPMGARLLKKWILHPLVDRKQIEERLETVEKLVSDRMNLEELRDLLSNVRDVERIVSRVEYNRSVPRDLVALRETLEIIPKLNEILSTFGVFKNLAFPERLLDLLQRAVEDDPAGSPGEGKVIKRGFSPELDEYRDLLEHAEERLKEFEEKERKRTGIQKLKVGYNQVFGYYIEVTKANLDKIPDDYERKQTLVNSERFITPELKEFETKIMAAKERIEELEKELFKNVCEEVKKHKEILLKISEELAKIDVLSTLAYDAILYSYTKPIFSEGRLEIKGGRHPIVERFTQNFVENDIYMDNERRFVVITGPNMSGKSTFIRQVGLISLMAQIGSFVPAQKAILPVFDRIFTRMGARDDLAGGRSTFLVEMNEMALILLKSTEKSLVLLDEVGRGTSTQDGVSIAWAISEELIKRGCKVLFATHFTELTELEKHFPQVQNKTILVKEEGKNVIFTHKVVDGVADRSYGIEVAKIAGIPDRVINRAYEILERNFKNNTKKNGKSNRFSQQIPLFPV